MLGKGMHKPMARATQPRNILQILLAVPSPLHSLVVHEPWDKVVVAQIDPIAGAEFAGGYLPSRGGGWGWGVCDCCYCRGGQHRTLSL